MTLIQTMGWITVLLFTTVVHCVEPGHEDRTAPGVVESPSYPRPYPKESQYSWKFERASGHWAVVFEDMDIERSEHCNDDYLLIRDPVINRELVRACGVELPEPVYSAGSKILISFHSDRLNEGKGFRIHVFHDKSQEALRARLSHKPTTVETKPAESAEIRLSRDDLLIYSLSLALLVAILVLICLGGWIVYHHCLHSHPTKCCGCSGSKGSKDTIINMDAVQVTQPGKRYSKPRLKPPQPDVTEIGSNNVYLPMPDNETLDQSQSSSLAPRTSTDAQGTNQLPVFHTPQSSQFEEVKFIGVM